MNSFAYLCILVFALSLFACQTNTREEMVFPGETWSSSPPSTFGIDKGKMQTALSYLELKSFEDGIEEVIIVKNGSVIFQGDSVSKSHNIYSCSKSFTSTVLGLLIDQGKLSLDSKVASYDSSLMALYPEASFRHFATMTSGFSAKGRSRWNDENADWSWTPYDPEQPHFPPGSHFEYWDEAQMTFGKVLTQVLREPMYDFLKRELTDKIQMGEWQWHPEQEVNGLPINNGCTSVIVNAKQLARFGHLYLNRGNWDGEQLLSASWCEQATSPQVEATIPVFDGDRSSARGSGSYGFNWWVNSEDGLSRMPDAPLVAAYMSGFNHNVCCIIPEWGMVIVRMGNDQNPPEGKHVVWNEFLKLMGEAIE